MAKPRVKQLMRLVLAVTPLLTWSVLRAGDVPIAQTLAEPANVPAAAGASPASPRMAPRGLHPKRRTPEQVLDERVAGLGRVLGLDDSQKAEVRKILLVQQSQLRQVWSDPARTSADRIGVSNAINKQTEDRIRSLLNETQRQQYIASRPAGTGAGQPEHGLEYWMEQMQRTH